MMLSILLALFASLAASVQADQTVDIFAWPLSASKSQTLAQISYNATYATVKKYTAPNIPNNNELVRIGYYPIAGSWSGVATAASNFALEKDRKVQLYLNTADELYHVGFKASDLKSSSKSGSGQDGLGVEVIKIQKGPTPHLNKPVQVNAEGQEDSKEPEKTFLQKYWWLIVGFLVIQVFVASGSKE